MNRRTVLFPALFFAVLAIPVEGFREPARACLTPTVQPPPLVLRFVSPTKVKVIAPNYATVNAVPGEFCAVGLTYAEGRGITAVNSLQVVWATGRLRMGGFSFFRDARTTAAFNAQRPSPNWQGFLSDLGRAMLPDTGVDLEFYLTVESGTSFPALETLLRSGWIGTSKANADGSLVEGPNGYLSITAPGSISEPQRAGWATLEPMPAAGGLAQTTTVSDGDTVYVVGGMQLPSEMPVNTVMAYDPPSNLWRTLEPIPVSPGIRAYGAACACGGMITVVGGFDGSAVLDQTWSYDIANNNWSRRANLPAPRFASAVTNTFGMGYVFGGFQDTAPGSETATTWVYDRTSDTWQTNLASMPVPLARIRAVVLKDLSEIHVFGGGRDGTTHLIYNREENTWSFGPPIPFGVSEPAVVSDGVLVYVLGGIEGPGRTQIFDRADNSWSQGAVMPGPINLTSGAYNPANGTIYVEGGFDGQSALSVNYALPVGP